jgi:mannose-6-phosphate isomerase-like protein (cupin superfamily)
MDIYSEERPWGSFKKFHENRQCTVKLIYVNPEARLSLQYHHERWEFWEIIKGIAEVELDGVSHLLNEGESITIPIGSKHRVKAQKRLCVILEISYGKFDENDIVRVEDDYQRS